MEKYKQQLIDVIMKTVAIDSVEASPESGAPFGRGVRKALDYVLGLCDDMGMTTKNLDGYCGYADIGEGEPFAVLGHLDVVPLGKGWTKNPLGEISDGVMYGRGVMDDKGPTLSCLIALKSLLDEGLKPTRKIRFIFGCNEESGWKCIDHYNSVEKMPDEGISPDSDFPVINCEKGIVNYKISVPFDAPIRMLAGERANVVPSECEVYIPADTENTRLLDEKGISYEIEKGTAHFTAFGKSAHASTPSKGVNAAVLALGTIKSLNKRIEEVYDAFYTYTGKGAGLDLADEQSGALTVNLGVLTIDKGEFSFVIDIRYPVTFKEDLLLSKIKAVLPDWKIEKVHSHPPLYVDRNDALVQKLLSAYEKVTGEKAEPLTIGGGTYARALKHGVAFGAQFPDEPSTIHQPDECVKISSLMKMTEIYREALRMLCFE